MNQNAAFLLAAALACGAVPAACEAPEIPGELTDPIAKLISAQVNPEYEPLSVYDRYLSKDVAGDPLPSSFDLRDKGVVTPVKLQFPFGTCWCFSSIAASETSILSRLGLTCDEFAEKYGYPMDLSELQAVWFVHRALPETDDNPSAGEGTFYVNQRKNAEMAGGTVMQVGELFAAGTGPVFESEAPYRGKEGITAEETTSRGSLVHCYSEEDEWSLSEELRGACDFDLLDCSELICPAMTDADGTYYYNPYGTYDIKSSLYQGYAVAISFCADNSMPGRPTETAYMNTAGENPPWAHYTYDTRLPNHGVTVVGWDDNYPASNFTEGHQPPANGAWIVKNSWGSLQSDEMNTCDWGYQGSGCFYLSYYDRSLANPTVFRYDVSRFTDGGAKPRVAQYDRVLPACPVSARYEDNIACANVFTVPKDCKLTALTLRTADYDSSAVYMICKLSPDAADPLDGRLLESKSVPIEHAGVHRIALDRPFALSAGDRIAVITYSVTRAADGSVTYTLPVNIAYNLKNALNSADPTSPETYNAMYYDNAVLNRGESFIRYRDVWYDLKDVAESLAARGGDCRFADLDNFTVKAVFTD